MERKRLFVPSGIHMLPALFLDRDGVLIVDNHYLSDPQKVEILPGADELLKLASARGWAVVIITNQSGISRGFFDWNAYEAVTESMLMKFNACAAIKGIYANGYGPCEGSRSWRKPNPGMIWQAASDLNIDLQNSILVGDRLSDICAGLNAGIPTLVHVQTGHGAEERSSVKEYIVSQRQCIIRRGLSFHMINDLLEFPDSLLSDIQISI